MKKGLFFLSLLGVMILTAMNLSAQTPEKVVLVEISNGVGCSPCLNTFEEIRTMHNLAPEGIACAYYVEPPMGTGNAWYWWESPMSDVLDTFNILYQSDCLVDRTFMNNNNSYPESEVVESVGDAYLQQSWMSYVPVAIDITHSFDPLTREVNADVRVDFVDTASGNLGIYFIMVQDEVVGPSSPGVFDWYDQLGDPFEAEMYGYTDLDSLDEDLVAINSYPHFKAVQYVASGFFGNEGVINSSVGDGDSFIENFSFVLDEYASPQSLVPLDPESMEIIVAVVKNNGFKNRPVLNAAKKRLLDVDPMAIAEQQPSVNPLKIQGNPVLGDKLSVAIHLEENNTGAILLFNVLGEKVYEMEGVEAIAGHTKEFNIPVQGFDPGVYFVAYKVGAKQYSRKVVIQ